MTQVNKILAVALAIQVLLIGFVLTRRERASIGRLTPIATLDAAAVTRIEIFAGAPEGEPDEAASKAPAIALVKKDGAWFLASHFDYPADAAKVIELLGKLGALKSRGPVATGAARATQLEVADDDFQRKLVVSEAGKEQTIFLGTSAGPRKTAVRVAGSDEIHGISGITAPGIASQPNAYAVPVYAEVPEAEIASVTITSARGTFELSRSGEAWQASIDGKPALPAAGQELDATRLAALVKSAAKIELAAPADPTRVIDKPEATITVRSGPAPGAADPAADAVSIAGDERVFDLVSDKDDRYLVRQRGAPRAVLVDGFRLRELVEIDRDKLFRKAGAPTPGPETGMEGLPPEILEQLRQQGAMPGGPP